jgi:hypothetical protein
MPAGPSVPKQSRRVMSWEEMAAINSGRRSLIIESGGHEYVITSWTKENPIQIPDPIDRGEYYWYRCTRCGGWFERIEHYRGHYALVHLLGLS